MPRDRAFQLLESAARTALRRQASAVRNPRSRATSSENLPTGTATAPLPSGIRADEPSRPKSSRQARPPDPKRQEPAQAGNPIRKPPGRPGDRAPPVRNPRRSPTVRGIPPGSQDIPRFPPASAAPKCLHATGNRGRNPLPSGIRVAGHSHPKTSRQTRQQYFSVRNPRRRAVSPQILPADQAAGSQTSGIRAAGQSHPKTSRQAGRPDPSRQEFAPKSPSREKPPSKASSRSQPATRPTGIPRPTHRLLAAECRTLSAIPPNNQVQIHAQIESSSRDSRAPRCAIHAAAL